MKFELGHTRDKTRPVVRLHFASEEAYSSLHRLLVPLKIEGLGTTGSEEGWVIFFPLTSWTHVDDFVAVMRELNVEPFQPWEGSK